MKMHSAKRRMLTIERLMNETGLSFNYFDSLTKRELTMYKTGTRATGGYSETLVERCKNEMKPINRKQFVFCSNPETHKQNNGGSKNNRYMNEFGTIVQCDGLYDRETVVDTENEFGNPISAYYAKHEKCETVVDPSKFRKTEPMQPQHEMRYHAEHNTTNNRIPLNTKKPVRRVSNVTNQTSNKN